DFNRDGMDDLLAVNLTDWGQKMVAVIRGRGTNLVPYALYESELPGWGPLDDRDQFFAADFDGDRRKDIYVFNGKPGPHPTAFLLMLHMSNSLFVVVKRYDLALPNLTMGPNEKFLVGDLNGDGKDDLVTWNGSDFAQARLALFYSTGTNLVWSQTYYGNIIVVGGGFGYSLREHDQPILLDFNGDGRKDLALLNNTDWGSRYLGLFTMSTNVTLQPARLHTNTVGAWKLATHDIFRAGDANGDGRDDLIVLNADSVKLDWGSPQKWLGTLL